mgnify:FL=1
MITGQYKNDLGEYKRFSAYHLFVARGIRAYLYPIVFLIFAAALLAAGILSANGVLYFGAAVLFAVALALPAIMLALQNAKIEKSVRANRNFLRTTHSFTFTEEGVGLTVKVQEKQEEYNIVRIFERPDVFYIYISGTQALIVPKSSLEGGTADDLAALFRVLKKRFREKKNLRGRTLPQE